MTRSVRQFMVGWVAAMFAAVASHAAVEPTFRDLVYANVSPRCKLDLYLPPSGTAPYPVIVYIHGGSWVYGDRWMVEPYAEPLINRGFAVAAISYRLAPQVIFPTPILDCKGAIRFLRAKANLYGLDANRIGVFGDSAGAHLAMLVAMTHGVAGMEGTVGGNTSFSSKVQACGDIAGPSDLLQLIDDVPLHSGPLAQLFGFNVLQTLEHRNEPAYAAQVAIIESADPAQYLTPDDPSLVILHASGDELVPWRQGQRMFDAESAVGNDVTYYRPSGLSHALPPAQFQKLYRFFEDQFLPSPTGMVRTLASAATNDEFGWSVAILGDVNGDGWKDVAVGSPFDDGGGADRGSVTITSGRDGTLIKVLRGSTNGEKFGWAIASLGDVNGDGRGDFAVASPRYRSAGANAGRVVIVSGKNFKVLRTLNGKAGGDQFGYALASGADLDGDGVHDLIVGAPYSDVAGTNAGRVYLHSGKTGKLIKALSGQTAGDNFGFSVAYAGHIRAATTNDVIIGAPYHAGKGRAYIYGRVSGKWKRLSLYTGASAGGRFGYVVSGAGDYDGDGRDDVAIAAPFAFGTATHTGTVRIVSGRTAATLATLTAPAGAIGSRFGIGLASAGDVTGDGKVDLLVGSLITLSTGRESGVIRAYDRSGVLPRATMGTSMVGGDYGRAMDVGRISSNGPWHVLIGSPLNDPAHLETGHAYLLRLSEMY